MVECTDSLHKGHGFKYYTIHNRNTICRRTAEINFLKKSTSLAKTLKALFRCLVTYVEKAVVQIRGEEIRSSLFILYLQRRELYGLGREEESKIFHTLHVMG